MEQYTDIQYDDDLTGGNEEYDDSYYTGAEDLFGFTPDEESPISRLKSLVLSIDWEITDEVLVQFNEELVDLRDIWAGNKINLVYVQALEKLSKYIYQKKADAHPSAIKLLLTLYYNLERIVSSEDLSESEKKEILLEDVKRFENLKSHLKTTPDSAIDAVPQPVIDKPAVSEKGKSSDSPLLKLKAIVLGIDWEITDEDLSALRKEVMHLESLFAGSRTRLILLQGIGTIGAYIKVKKSNSHADAFKVLHLFYDSLEKIVDAPMTLEEEKAVLFPAVERFNEFKKLLGSTISPESIKNEEETEQSEIAPALGAAVVPAFSDIPEDEVKGFQADEEAAALGIETPDNVNSHVADFFGDDDSFEDARTIEDDTGTLQKVTDTLENQFDETKVEPIAAVSEDIALQGVDVEEGDEEEDEDPAGADAIAFVSEDDVQATPASVPDEDENAGPQGASIEVAEQVEEKLESQFDEAAVLAEGEISREEALAGVDVELGDGDEDGDDSIVAFASDEQPDYPGPAEPANEISVDDDAQQVAERLSEKLESQFDESVAEPVDQVPAELALQGVDVEEDDEEEEEELSEEEFAAFDSDGASDFPATVIDIGMEAETDSAVTELSADVEDEDDIAPALSTGQDEEKAEINFPPEADDAGSIDFAAIDKDAALQGVDVESEADDDSDEEALPVMEGELAPALVDNDEVSIYNADSLDDTSISEDGLEEEIADTVLDFFGEEDGQPESPLVEDTGDTQDSSTAEESLGFAAEDEIDVAGMATEEPAAASDERVQVVEAEAEPGDGDAAFDIESQLDDFFGSDDEGEEDHTAPVPEEASVSLAEVAAAGASGVAATAITSGLEGTEEDQEVVFELVDEEVDGGSPGIAAASGVSESGDDEQTSPDVTERKTQPFENLGDCIDAVGVELEDKILTSLLQEIDSASQELSDAPLEKTFLQLLRTVALHIDRYRYESGHEAYSLLKSVFEAMSLGQMAGEQKQELLLAQTTRVLNWQQDIILNQTEKNKDSAALSEPLFVQELGGGGNEAEDLIASDGDVLAEKSDTILQTGHKAPEDIKQEISSLKQSLKDEISSLKKQS